MGCWRSGGRGSSSGCSCDRMTLVGRPQWLCLGRWYWTDRNWFISSAGAFTLLCWGCLCTLHKWSSGLVACSTEEPSTEELSMANTGLGQQRGIMLAWLCVLLGRGWLVALKSWYQMGMRVTITGLWCVEGVKLPGVSLGRRHHSRSCRWKSEFCI